MYNRKVECDSIGLNTKYISRLANHKHYKEGLQLAASQLSVESSSV